MSFSPTSTDAVTSAGPSDLPSATSTISPTETSSSSSRDAITSAPSPDPSVTTTSSAVPLPAASPTSFTSQQTSLSSALPTTSSTSATSSLPANSSLPTSGFLTTLTSTTVVADSQGAPMTIVDTIVVSTTILTLSTSTQSVSGPTSTHSSTASTDGNAQQSVTGPATIAGITVLSVIGMVILCQLVSTVVRCRRNRHWRLEQRLDEGTWRRSIPESNRHSSQPRQRMLALATTLPGRPVSLGDAVEPLTASDRSRRTGTTSSLSKSSFVSFMEPAVTQQSRASLLLHVFGPPAGGDEQPLLQQHPNLSIQQQQQQRQPQQYNHLQPHSAVTVAWTAERGLALSRLSATPTPVAVLVDSGGGSYAANSEMSHSYSSRDDVYSLSPPLPPQQQVWWVGEADRTMSVLSLVRPMSASHQSSDGRASFVPPQDGAYGRRATEALIAGLSDGN